MQEFKKIVQSCLDQQSEMFKKEFLRITKRIDKLENHFSKESKKIEKIHTILLKIERRKPTTKKPVQTKKTQPDFLDYEVQPFSLFRMPTPTEEVLQKQFSNIPYDAKRFSLFYSGHKRICPELRKFVRNSYRPEHCNIHLQGERMYTYSGKEQGWKLCINKKEIINHINASLWDAFKEHFRENAHTKSNQKISSQMESQTSPYSYNDFLLFLSNLEVTAKHYKILK